MYRAAHPKGLGTHSAPRLGPSPSRPRPGSHHPLPGAPGRTAAPAVRQCRRTRTTRTSTSGLLGRLGAQTLCYCFLDPIPPLKGGMHHVPLHRRRCPHTFSLLFHLESITAVAHMPCICSRREHTTRRFTLDEGRAVPALPGMRVPPCFTRALYFGVRTRGRARAGQ